MRESIRRNFKLELDRKNEKEKDGHKEIRKRQKNVGNRQIQCQFIIIEKEKNIYVKSLHQVNDYKTSERKKNS